MRTKFTFLTLSLAFFGLSNNANAQWVNPVTAATHVNCIVNKGDTLFFGESNGIAYSLDNGNTWTTSNLFGEDPYVTAITAIGNNMFAVNNGGAFYASNDNGLSFTKTDFTFNSINTIFALGSSLFIGDDNTISESTDKGKTWTTRLTTASKVNTFAVLGNTLYAGTKSEGIYVSTDNGKTWTVLASSTAIVDVMSFLIIGNNIYASSYKGGVYLSNDNGLTWTAKNNGFGAYLYIAAITVHKGVLYAASSYGGVYSSPDNGENWTAMNDGLTNLTTICMGSDSKRIYTGTFGGGIFYTTSNVTTVEENAIATNGLYPNPSIDHLTIDKSDYQNTTLEVYNAQGSLLQSQLLTSSQTTIGTSSLSTGVYLVKLSNSNGTTVSRFVKE